jgi:hypothetical protein
MATSIATFNKPLLVPNKLSTVGTETSAIAAMAATVVPA